MRTLADMKMTQLCLDNNGDFKYYVDSFILLLNGKSVVAISKRHKTSMVARPWILIFNPDGSLGASIEAESFIWT